METRFCTNDDVGEVTGTVVVIDVLRAFTTAAVALSRQPRSYRLVRTTEEARASRAASSEVRILGEVDGRRPDGFDHSNSPVEMARAEVSGLDLVHRSTAGTQGAVLATGADQVWVASFAVAGATAAVIRQARPAQVTFCVTGASLGRDGDEDRACGELIARLVDDPDLRAWTPWTDRVDASDAGQMFHDEGHPDLGLEDLRFAKVVDRFDFAMRVDRRDDGVWLQPVVPG